MKRFIFVLLIFMLVFSLSTVIVFAEGEDEAACEHVYDNCLDDVCNLCHELRVAPGHSFTTWESNNDAACDKDGTETSHCDNCDAQSIRVVSGSELPHQYGEWTVVEDATETTEGLKKQTCTACGFENVETIPVISTEEENNEEEITGDPEEFDDLIDELASVLEDMMNEGVVAIEDLFNFVSNDDTYSTFIGVVLAILAIIAIPFAIAILIIAYIIMALIVVIVSALMSLLEAIVGMFAGFIV